MHFSMDLKKKKFEAKKTPKYMGGGAWDQIKYYNLFHVFIICS